MCPPPPRLQLLVQPQPQPQASRLGSSNPTNLRELNNTLQEPSLPKTILPRPPSLPTTAYHPAPSLPLHTSRAPDTPHLQATLSPLHLELLTHMPATARLMARATLNQALDIGKRGWPMLLILTHTQTLTPCVAPTVWSGWSSLLLFPSLISNIKSKYETSYPLSADVFVCCVFNTSLCSGPGV